MMWCASCGVEYAEGNRYCEDCGRPLVSRPSRVPESRRDKEKVFRLGLVGVILVGIGAAGAVGAAKY